MAGQISGVKAPAALGPISTSELKSDKQKRKRSFGEKLSMTGDILAEMVGLKAAKRLMDTPAETLLFDKGAAGQQAVADSFGAAGMAQVGSMPFERPANSVSIFVGRKARLKPAQEAAFRQATKMADDGLDMEAIRKATGWDIGPEGTWRYEIADDKMKLTPYGITKANQPTRVNNTYKPELLPRVGQAVDHPELLDLYPELLDMPILLQEDGMTGKGFFQPPQKIMGRELPASLSVYGPRNPATKSNMDDILAHELQHAVQYLEGQGMGANPDNIPSVVSRHYGQKVAKGEIEPMSMWELYRKNAAENEANATMGRRMLTAEQRRAIDPRTPDPDRALAELDFTEPRQAGWYETTPRDQQWSHNQKTGEILQPPRLEYSGQLSQTLQAPRGAAPGGPVVASRSVGATTPPRDIEGRSGAISGVRKKVPRRDRGALLTAEGPMTVGDAEGALPKKSHNKGPRIKDDPKFPELATRYPVTKEGVPAFDEKKGKWYIAKDHSEEALKVDKVRQRIMKEVAKHEYSPFFDPKKRARVDATQYPKTGKTIDVTFPKRAETVVKYHNKANDPEAIQRLIAGYEEGAKLPGAAQWYHMKQLEDFAKQELGEEAGRAWFEQWARSMAETTGGADPQTNFLAAQYLRHQRSKGQLAAEKSTDMPYPVGGRFMAGNMELANKNAGRPFDPALNPKRNNFEANFEGYPDATIDEVMMTKGFGDPAGAPEYYGPYQQTVEGLAKARGVSPEDFQGKAWWGLKRQSERARGEPASEAGPMIQIVNDSIERTARLLGISPEQAAKMLVRDLPMYGISGLLGAGALGAMGYGEGEKEPVI